MIMYAQEIFLYVMYLLRTNFFDPDINEEMGLVHFFKEREIRKIKLFIYKRL